MFRIFFCFLVVVNFSILQVSAQTLFEIPGTNTHATIQQQIASTLIKVEYNRPNAKGRKIFGALVPYGQVWRTGADASTKVYFSTPVSLENHAIDSGTYELFTIPGPDEWTVILQKNKSQWGSYKYHEENDVVRFKTKPQKLVEAFETFTISFDNITSNSGNMVLMWENTKVPILISIDLVKTVIPGLEERLLAEGRKPYFKAAMFYFENEIDINRATELMELALQENPDHLGMLYRQALIYERLGEKEKAIKSSKKSLLLAQSVGEELKAEYTKLNNELLQRLIK